MKLIAAIILTAVCAVIVIIVKDAHPEFSMILSLAAGAVLLLFAVNTLEPYLSQINSITQKTGNTELFITALKAVGICVLSEFAANTCADFGQSSLAAKARLMGRIGLLILALPYAAKVIETAGELLG